MASLITPVAGWRKPFEVIAILGAVFTVLYFFIREPEKGEAEPELKKLRKGNYNYKYEYKIEYKHLPQIISKESNKWLILQGFFMNLTTGTLIWLPTLYIAKLEDKGVPNETSVITAGYLFALLQMGGLFSTYFGHLGDRLQKKNYRGRALLGAISVLAAIPLYIIMYIIPMNGINLPSSVNPIIIFFALVKEILLNPWMLAIYIFAVAATAAQSANSPNYLALITDVNLPEHRATVFGISTLINGIGKSLGNIFIGFVLGFFSGYFQPPYNYIITMSLFQVFLIPSSLSYYMMSRNNGKDIRRVRSILRRRAGNI